MKQTPPQPTRPAQPAQRSTKSIVDPDREIHQIHDDQDDNDNSAAVVADLAPWAVSIVLHAALVMMAIMVVWIALPEVDEQQPIIPSAVLHERPGAPLKFKVSVKPEETSSQKRSVSKSKKITDRITTKVKADMSLIGVSAASDSKGAIFGKTVGIGAFDTGIFGVTGGNAKKIVYVVDASGSLLDTLPFVIHELRQSISKLREPQSFSVIFFTAGQPLEAAHGRGLLPATSENKARVLKWLGEGHVVPQGQASPVAAVKQALGYQPELIFLLSDNITGRGRYEMSQPQLLAEIRNANRSQTKINTIQYLYPDSLSKLPGMQGTLEMLSQETKGRYKFLSGRELGIGD